MNTELEILKQALQLEEEGYEFYMMASQDAENEDAKEALQELAGEEAKHKQWVLDMYEKIAQGDGREFDFSEVKTPSPGIFKWKNVPLDNISKGLSVMSIGVKMENSAVQFYTEAKKKTEDPDLQKLLEILIDWERQHLNDFQSRYDELQQEWWEQQRFSPS